MDKRKVSREAGESVNRETKPPVNFSRVSGRYKFVEINRFLSQLSQNKKSFLFFQSTDTQHLGPGAESVEANLTRLQKANPQVNYLN